MKYVWTVNDDIAGDVMVFNNLSDAESYASTILAQYRAEGYVTDIDGITFSRKAIKDKNMMHIELYWPNDKRDSAHTFYLSVERKKVR